MNAIILVIIIFLFYALYRILLRPKTAVISSVNSGYKDASEVSPIDISDNAHFSIRVESNTNRGTYYDVDIQLITCTCPDFITTRNKYETSDPRRLCKHLIKAFLETEKLKKGIIPVNLQMYKAEFARLKSYDAGFQCTDKIETEIEGQKFIIFAPADDANCWYNVYSDGGSEIRYGYNPQLQRWAHNEKPSHAKTLAPLIKERDKKAPKDS
jgi:hypothetical protein